MNRIKVRVAMSLFYKKISKLSHKIFLSIYKIFYFINDLYFTISLNKRHLII